MLKNPSVFREYKVGSQPSWVCGERDQGGMKFKGHYKIGCRCESARSKVADVAEYFLKHLSFLQSPEPRNRQAVRAAESDRMRSLRP